jgi:hypothetical protein
MARWEERVRTNYIFFTKREREKEKLNGELKMSGEG